IVPTQRREDPSGHLASGAQHPASAWPRSAKPEVCDEGRNRDSSRFALLDFSTLHSACCKSEWAARAARSCSRRVNLRLQIEISTTIKPGMAFSAGRIAPYSHEKKT